MPYVELSKNSLTRITHHWPNYFFDSRDKKKSTFSLVQTKKLISLSFKRGTYQVVVHMMFVIHQV